MNEVKTTATKAHVSAAATFIMTLVLYYLYQQHGIGNEVSNEEAKNALEGLTTAIVTSITAWVGTYFPTNKPKL